MKINFESDSSNAIYQVGNVIKNCAGALWLIADNVDGGEMVVNDVSSVSEYNNERGGLALELYGKGKTGKNKKMVFNLTSDNIVGYSIDEI